MLPEVGGYRAVEALDRGVQRGEHADGGEHGVAERLGERFAAGARRGGAQAGEQLGGGAAAGVAVLDQNAAIRFSPRCAAAAGVG